MFDRFKKRLTFSSSISKGKFYEGFARGCLEKQGMTFVTGNYHSRFGEIDLIMKDGNSMVFVEVRYRENQRYGQAGETVNHHKQKKIIKTAQQYLQYRGLTHRVPCRFDVIAITGTQDALRYHWIKNAFQY